MEKEKTVSKKRKKMNAVSPMSDFKKEVLDMAEKAKQRQKLDIDILSEEEALSLLTKFALGSEKDRFGFDISIADRAKATNRILDHYEKKGVSVSNGQEAPKSITINVVDSRDGARLDKIEKDIK